MSNFAIYDVLLASTHSTSEESPSFSDSRAETAKVDDKYAVINVTSGIVCEVSDTTVDTTVVGVGDSRAEAATDDGKSEVDNVTPGIVDDIPFDTTVGEDNGGVVGKTADAVKLG